MDDWPAQAISIVSQIVWCGITETILKSETDEDSIEGLDWWLGENIKQIGEITKLITRPELTQRKRKGMISLIT